MKGDQVRSEGGQWVTISSGPLPMPWRERPRAAWRLLTGGRFTLTTSIQIRQLTPAVYLDETELTIDRRSKT